MARGPGQSFRLSANGVPIRGTTLVQIGKAAATHFVEHGFSTPLIVTDSWDNTYVALRRVADTDVIELQRSVTSLTWPIWAPALVAQLRINNVNTKEVA